MRKFLQFNFIREIIFPLWQRHFKLSKSFRALNACLWKLKDCMAFTILFLVQIVKSCHKGFVFMPVTQFFRPLLGIIFCVILSFLKIQFTFFENENKSHSCCYWWNCRNRNRRNDCHGQSCHWLCYQWSRRFCSIESCSTWVGMENLSRLILVMVHNNWGRRKPLSFNYLQKNHAAFCKAVNINNLRILTKTITKCPFRFRLRI